MLWISEISRTYNINAVFTAILAPTYDWATLRLLIKFAYRNTDGGTAYRILSGAVTELISLHGFMQGW
jgi:hypothetical protein